MRDLHTYAVHYKIDIFPCRALIRAHSKEEADAKFVQEFKEIPLSIGLFDDEEDSFQQTSAMV